MEGEEMENRRKRRAEVKRKMIILSILLCGGLAVLLWIMLKFPKKVGIRISKKNCTDEMRICPPAWELITQNCFFQSEGEVTWAEGQRHCRTYFGSLAKITTTNEMKYVLSYLENSTYWIGLRKLASDTVWKWTDGSPIGNWFKAHGSGNCTFIDTTDIKITSCDGKRRYLCSRKSECA
ncbi:C-type lectin domain family 2 member B-like [Octodon degus]|uniref:C-type lectin domain family 2 member B-like n=1 Tax=Octodon degus TaxID=10160 RepID=A0A6P6DZQ7_OCTDE|nr:C-type lectin domain family 2 member B-like [Octodon degus]